jgi:hypothetical protein
MPAYSSGGLGKSVSEGAAVHILADQFLKIIVVPS